MDDLKSYLKPNTKSLLTVLILLAGLAVGVFLVQRTQILKSSASAEAVDITTEEGNAISQDESGQYQTDSLKVRINIKDVDKLKQLAPPR